MRNKWRGREWIIGGSIFGGLLSWVIGNTPLGVAIGATVGAVAGLVTCYLQHPRV